MSRSLDIGQALKYPFRADNWINTLLIPGLYLLGVLILTYVLQFTVGFVASIFIAILAELNEVLGILAFTVLMILMVGLSIVLQAPVMGYFWEVIGNLRTNGYEATAPDWKPIRSYLVNGLKYMAFQVALALIIGVVPAFFQVVVFTLLGDTDVAGILAMVIAILFVLAIFALTPFFYAPIIRTSESKSLGEMFDFGKAVEAGSRCYGKAMLALLVSLGMALISIPLILLSLCTIVGYPMLLSGLIVVIYHLMAQAFDDYREEEEPAGSQTT